MRYCVLYPNTSNVNLVKEMGMIPYKLYKLYGYDSKIVCYKQDEYFYLDKEVKGLKIEFIEKKTGKYSIDGVNYLLKHSKEIDILQVFHVTLYSMCYSIIYKLLNKKGKIYLKLDCSYKLVDRIKGLGKLDKMFLNYYLNKIDLISVEQKKLYPQLKKLLKEQKEKIINIPNGVDFDFLEEENIIYDYSKKENIILHVARIGAEEKNTPLLLESFAQINNITKSGWKLYLVGPIEQHFEKYINNYYEKYPELRDIVIFKGEITDRKELFKLYSKSKIFTLTSDFESFGIAFIEAAALGNIIISTDVGIASEITSSGGGKVVPCNDKSSLSRAFEEYIFSKKLEPICEFNSKICKNNYNWNNIIEILYKNLR